MPIIHGDGLLCDAWQILSQRGWRSGYRHWLTDGAGGFETRMSARHELNLGGGAPLALAHHHLLRLLLP